MRRALSTRFETFRSFTRYLTHTTPIDITSTASGLTKGTTAIDQITWRKQGDIMQLHAQYRQTTAGTDSSKSNTDADLVTVPGGYSINTAKQEVSTDTTQEFPLAICGQSWARLAAGSITYYGWVQAWDENNLGFVWGGPKQATNLRDLVMSDSAWAFGFVARIPIVGWK